MTADEIRSVVDKLSEFQLIRPNKIINSYYSCYCPIHNDGNERKASFGILLEDQMRNGQMYKAGWCHCFSCGYVGMLPQLITDILKSKSIGVSGKDWLLQNVPGISIDSDSVDHLIPTETMSTLLSKHAADYLVKQTQPSTHYVSEEELKRYRYVVPYMYERKLTDEIIEKYDVGYQADWIPEGRKKPVPCITFPVKDKQGRTLFICRRSIQGKIYNYPTGVTKPLYGIDQVPADCKSLIICESAINALTLATWGYIAVALLGTGNQYQVQQLRQLGVREFILCMDGDDAGHRASAKLKRQLQDCAIIWTVNMPSGKDVNDCSKEEFQNLYEKRE